jgi:hypothetical protein
MTLRYHIRTEHQSMTDTDNGAVVVVGRDGEPDLVITFENTEAARGFALNAVDVLAAKYDATRP